MTAGRVLSTWLELRVACGALSVGWQLRLGADGS